MTVPDFDAIDRAVDNCGRIVTEWIDEDGNPRIDIDRNPDAKVIGCATLGLYKPATKVVTMDAESLEEDLEI